MSIVLGRLVRFVNQVHIAFDMSSSHYSFIHIAPFLMQQRHFSPTVSLLLFKGARDVTAVDMEPDHLRVLALNVEKQQPQNAEHLKLVVGTFPDPALVECLTDGGRRRFDAILTRNVLHFVHESEMQVAFNRLFELLNPGGKIFATNITPYTRHFKQQMRDTFERQLARFKENVAPAKEQNGGAETKILNKTVILILRCLIAGQNDDDHKVPGFVPDHDDVIDWESMEKQGFKLDDMSWPKGHLFCFQVLSPCADPLNPIFNIHETTFRWIRRNTLRQAGFHVEPVYYDPLSWPNVFKLDDREFLSFVASKPINA